MDFPYRTMVVGVTYDDRQEVIAGLQVGQWLGGLPQRDNPHDANAIGLWTNDPAAPQGLFAPDRMVGYLSREVAAEVRPLLHANLLRARVTGLYGGTADKPTRGVAVELHLKPKGGPV